MVRGVRFRQELFNIWFLRCRLMVCGSRPLGGGRGYGGSAHHERYFAQGCSFGCGA